MGDYNKPITTRIQQSTKGGMKVQDPLLNLGSPYKANAALIEGAAAIGDSKKFVDHGKTIKESIDKEAGKETSEKEAPESPATFNPALRKAADEGKLNPGFERAVKAAAKKYKY